MYYYFFFFKQKTAYEMRISDWSSDVCSSDLRAFGRSDRTERGILPAARLGGTDRHRGNRAKRDVARISVHAGPLRGRPFRRLAARDGRRAWRRRADLGPADRKSTLLNSSH